MVFVGIALAGCSPESYRRGADREVSRILRDRKDAALGYQPDTPAGDADAPAPAARKPDYQRIPATAIPPPATPAIAAPVVNVPYGPLGPDPDVVPVQRGYRFGSLGGDEEFEVFRGLEMGPPAPGVGGRRFDLFGALKFAVQNSREYQDRMEDLYLAALDVTLERHLFAPRPFARAGLEYTGGQRDVDYRSALAATATAGVRQQLPYGGEVTAETLVRFVDALEGQVGDGESAEVVLSGSLPLLRGAGLVNLEPLIASERTLVYEVRDFEVFRRQFAVSIASQYFGLLAQQQSVANRLQNYASLAALLEQTLALHEAQIEARPVSFLDVQRSEQSLLQAENSLIDARQSYANDLDDFKIALGMDVNESLDVVPVELDVAVPDIRGDAALEIAHRYRLELQTARDRITDAVRTVEVARNGLLPDVNLTGSASTGNRAGTPARQLDSRTLEYSAGVQVDLPVDRVAERNAYRRSLIGFDRAQRGYEDLREQVTAQVRSDARGIRLAQSTLVIQKRGIELAERRLELATDLLRQDKSDAREVVEAQEDLLNAQDAYERAQAQLQIRVLEFLRDTGTLRIDPDAGELGQALDRGGEAGGGVSQVEQNAGPIPQ
jgi:outer membrane protein TolC